MGQSIIALAAVGGLHLLNRWTSFHLNCLIELVPARIWFLACWTHFELFGVRLDAGGRKFLVWPHVERPLIVYSFSWRGVPTLIYFYLVTFLLFAIWIQTVCSFHTACECHCGLILFWVYFVLYRINMTWLDTDNWLLRRQWIRIVSCWCLTLGNFNKMYVVHVRIIEPLLDRLVFANHRYLYRFALDPTVGWIVTARGRSMQISCVVFRYMIISRGPPETRLDIHVHV